VKIGRLKAILYLLTGTKLHLCVQCKTAYHLIIQESLGKVCVQHTVYDPVVTQPLTEISTRDISMRVNMASA